MHQLDGTLRGLPWCFLQAATSRTEKLSQWKKSSQAHVKMPIWPETNMV